MFVAVFLRVCVCSSKTFITNQMHIIRQRHTTHLFICDILTKFNQLSHIQIEFKVDLGWGDIKQHIYIYFGLNERIFNQRILMAMLFICALFGYWLQNCSNQKSESNALSGMNKSAWGQHRNEWH